MLDLWSLSFSLLVLNSDEVSAWIGMSGSGHDVQVIFIIFMQLCYATTAQTVSAIKFGGQSCF